MGGQAVGHVLVLAKCSRGGRLGSGVGRKVKEER